MKPILEMLCQKKIFESKRLGTIYDTHHTIDLKKGSRSICSQPCHAKHRCRDVVFELIHMQLEASLMKPANLKWASPIQLAPEKNYSIQYCVDYQLVNAATLQIPVRSQIWMIVLAA